MENNTAVIEEKKSVRNYVKTWGIVFSEFGNQGREKCVQEMDARFPEKVESNHKWADWYKAYFNMGKIKGFETHEKLSWKKSENN